MKLFYENKKINFNKNIAIIYYNDFNQKEDWLSNLIFNFKKSNFDYEGDLKVDDLLYIDINIDLKKEFTLSKTSNLRKEIVKETIEYLDFNNFEASKVLDEETSNNISKYIEEKFSTNKYRLLLKNKIKKPSDIIDSLYKLSIVDDENNELSTNDFNQWNLSYVYVDILLNDYENIKNKLIIINDYDQFILKNEFIFEFIEKLFKNNLIILVTRNTTFLNKNYLLKSLSILNNNQLNNIIIQESILENYILMKDFIGDELEFEQFKINSKFLIENNDIKNASTILCSSLKIVLDSLKNQLKMLDLSFLNEFAYLLILFFIEDNKEFFSNIEISYKNKKSKLTNYILEKYIEK